MSDRVAGMWYVAGVVQTGAMVANFLATLGVSTWVGSGQVVSQCAR